YASNSLSVIANIVQTNEQHGIEVGQDRTIERCTVIESGLDGIHVQSGCAVRDNTVLRSEQDGIDAIGHCAIERNFVAYNGPQAGAGTNCGIQVRDVSVVDQNRTYANNNKGLSVYDVQGSIVIRNVSRHNISNYAMSAYAGYGPVGQPGTNDSPWLNSQ
ncbi:MAG TPA: right-handed parallel beta-helix repeat-containing protein, partial [Kiritimatiellia bacterium]